MTTFAVDHVKNQTSHLKIAMGMLFLYLGPFHKYKLGFLILGTSITPFDMYFLMETLVILQSKSVRVEYSKVSKSST